MSDNSSSRLWTDMTRLLGRVRDCDRSRLGRELDRLKSRRPDAGSEEIDRILSNLKSSVEEKRRRKANPPSVRYPEELPISSRRNDIVQAIRSNQVIILSGETGSGKTTQIPKMCIEAGGGVDGLIGCTQPRRIAALTVASRIAEELGNEDLVGCKIRFSDNTSAGNFIRVMTDGILLAEAQGNPSLSAYDTLIIDEAHERSLNIDVLLGMVRRLVDKRPRLKVVITSATLDTQKFSKHFSNAPVIEVTGRTFPVEIRYENPSEDSNAMSLAERTSEVVQRLVRQSSRGDILVFLPTEQDIRETMDQAARDFSDRLDIVPLYARLPASDQKRAFQTGGRRKLVVATNVAETSLTIPGIRYVVDSGLARISRYNPGTGTHGLPVDPISRASADQRAGRCGRVENGICIRMYSKEDYESRPLYTPPEIRRTNLAEVILRLISLGISDIEGFPFVDPPDPAGIRDGLSTLKEIGALAPSTGRAKKRVLSEDGRLMAKLPLDPRLARVLLQADREGCLGDVLPVASALSLPDPRERPPEKTGTADRAHRVFLDEQSDFMGALNLWDAFRTYGRKGSYSGKLKKFCAENYLSFRRMREWMDIHQQLTLVMEENGYRLHRSKVEPSQDSQGRFSSRYSAIHRSMLSGFLSHIARLEEQGLYQATRNRKLRIHPGSALHRSGSLWIMAGEIVHTSRLYGRWASAIDPDWLIDLGADLAEKNWIQPHWSRKEGAVMATEQIRLYGFLISQDRIVPYGAVRPKESRSIFIHSALVEYDIPDISHYGFLKANRRMINQLSQIEEKLRRRDLVAGEDAIEAFYDRNLPGDVIDLGTLNRLIREKGDRTLIMTESDLLTGVVGADDLKSFPDSAEVAGEKWKLTYVFNPESADDGATLKIPSGHLSDLTPGKTDWMVPGLLREKVEALMRGLPKHQRRLLIPIGETAEAAVNGMDRNKSDVVHALSEWLYRECRIDIPPAAWKEDDLPAYLKVRLSLTDDSGREIAAGRNPSDLLSVPKRAEDAGRSGVYRRKNEVTGLTMWPIEDLPESVTIPGGARLWPALTDDEDSVSLRFYNERHEAEGIHLCGQVRLAKIHWAREWRNFRRSLVISGPARNYSMYIGGSDSLELQLWDRVFQEIFGRDLIRTGTQWSRYLFDGGGRIFNLAEDFLERISTVLETYGEVRRDLDDLAQKSHRSDFIRQRFSDLQEILPADFVARYEPQLWEALPRWLKAIVSRGRRGSSDPGKELRAAQVWTPLRDRLQSITENLSPLASAEKIRAVAESKVALQELRVALFAAGEIRPAGKVSESRMKKFLDDIERML